MKNIKVAREQINGRLDLAILAELEEKGIIINDTEESADFIYNIDIFNKGNRKNGKLFCRVAGQGVEKYYYITNVYRFNTWQECKLTEIEPATEKIDMIEYNY